MHKNNPFSLVINPTASSIRGAVTMQIEVLQYSLFFVHNQAYICTEKEPDTFSKSIMSVTSSLQSLIS